MTVVQEGGCLCGAIRYRAEGEPKWVVHCHCSSCRKATGAPYVTYAGYEMECVHFQDGEPAQIESSPGAFRRFCSKCGTSLSFHGDGWPGEIHLIAGSFDEPDKLRPQAHIYGSAKMPWVRLDDGLPVFPEFPKK